MSKLELPHELLLRKYVLDINKLSSHTRQLKSDLDKIMMMIVNKSRNGQINMTPATKSKIDTYDRYICDGIFEYLENADVINEDQADSIESQMDSQRQSQMNKINTENNTSNQQNSQNNTGSGGDAKIGFWDWA